MERGLRIFGGGGSGGASPATTPPLPDALAAAVGTGTTYARADHAHPGYAGYMWQPKILVTQPPQVCSVPAAPGAGQGWTVRVPIPLTGTIIGLAVFLTTSAGNIDIGIYDTSAGTRNRLASIGATAAGTVNQYQAGTISLPVTAGDDVDFAASASSTAAFASAPMDRSEMGQMPAGWMTVPLGGKNAIQTKVISGFNPLPLTLAESAMLAGNQNSIVCIMALYA